MKKSSYVPAIETVQKPVTEFLRKAGFKKNGRTYNRTVDDGLIQVINFQMGEYPIGNYVIPGVRESMYGSFVVNIGVFLPCVFLVESGKLEKKFIQEYYCHIRNRLGELAEGKDVWWSLDNSPEKTGDLMVSLLEKFGFPFLYKFSNYEAVLSHFQTFGKLPFNTEGRSALVAAIICHTIGNMKSAAELFDKAAGEAIKSKNLGFENYVGEIRRLCSQ